MYLVASWHIFNTRFNTLATSHPQQTKWRVDVCTFDRMDVIDDRTPRMTSRANRTDLWILTEQFPSFPLDLYLDPSSTRASSTPTYNSQINTFATRASEPTINFASPSPKYRYHPRRHQERRQIPFFSLGPEFSCHPAPPSRSTLLVTATFSLGLIRDSARRPLRAHE